MAEWATGQEWESEMYPEAQRWVAMIPRLAARLTPSKDADAVAAPAATPPAVA